MTSAERREEAGAVSAIFHASLTSLGFRVLADAIRLWADVSAEPTKVASTSGRWIAYALSMVGKRRAHARQLSMSYYRLVRALHTGYSINDPVTGTEQDSVPLNELREAFYNDVEEFSPEVLAHGEQEIEGAHAESSEDFSDVPQVPDVADEETVELETLESLLDILQRIDDAAEDEARIVLEALGPANLEQKLDLIDDSLPAKEADELREQARRSAGNRQAAAAERVALNGGRAVLSAIAEKDPRVLGYVRVSRTGTPCGWCAMLISRGLVLYRSESSASTKADGDLYHDNCRCYAVPVFSEEQYDEDPQFALNRDYAALWPKVTRGYSGDEALSVWRRYFRANQSKAQAA